MYLEFLTRWIKHLTAGKLGVGDIYKVAYRGSVMVTVKSYCSCGKYYFFKQNEWACDGDSESTFHTYDYSYRVVHVLTAFPQSIIHIYNITKAKRALWLANSASTICPWVYADDVLNN